MTSAAVRRRQFRAERSRVAAQVSEEQLVVVMNGVAVVHAAEVAMAATNVAAAVHAAEVAAEIEVPSRAPVRKAARLNAL